MKIKKVILGLMFTALATAAGAQGKYGETEEDSISCLKNLSLYTEFYNQKAFDDALRPMVDAMNTCPKSSKNLYIRGGNILNHKLKQLKAGGDDEQQAKYLDTLKMMYDLRIEHFGQRGYVLGRKGTDMLRYGSSSDFKEAYDVLRESAKLSGEKTQAGILSALYQAAYVLQAKGVIEKEEALELYGELSEIVAANKGKEGEEGYKKAQEAIDQIFGKIATCTDLVEIFTPRFEADPNDEELLENIIGLLEMQNCADEELFLQASKNLDEINPSGESKYGIGVALLKKQEYEEAVKYLKEAADLLDDDVERKVSALNYAASALMQLRKYPEVKQTALKALKADPENGEAYMHIGDAYFYGSKSVGDSKCTKAGGYWASIPKYQKAKSLDPELADKANRKIGSARAQFPDKQECFFEDITDGQSFEVGGWINETVTVETK